MKKITALLLMLVMAVSLLGTITAFADDDIPEPDVLDFVTTETIVTPDILDFDLTFEKMSDSFAFHKAEHPGTDMFIDYTTDAYDDGVTYDKWCRVYLPYGYDPEDTETKYNVIYFQHGNNGNPNEFFDHTIKKKVGYGVKNIFDNMMDPEYGIMEPCIVVCPTFYFYASKDAWNVRPDGDESAGDGRYEGIAANYYKEVVEDLIPAVESQLNTYCDDFSEEGIIASRDHRMWSGYSRGSCCTWYLFHYDMPYIKYWMPMSAECLRETVSIADDHDPEDSYQYLKETVDTYPDYDFFIFASAGGQDDGAGVNMGKQMKYFMDKDDCIFSYGLDPEVNNFYFTCSDFDHNDIWMPYTLFNYKGIIFNGEVDKASADSEEVPAEQAEAEADQAEEPAGETVSAAEYDIPEGYTKVKVFDGTYGFGDAEITVAANDDESAFYITFEAFDEEQILEGTIEDGICSVDYDETGFMTGDCQLIWDDAAASENPWVNVQ